MFLSPFFNEQSGTLHISPDQASQFAKQVACDFNPIHDPTAKRFCVPGDLLFSLILMKQGLFKAMQFNFQGMVGKDTPIHIAQTAPNTLTVRDKKDKHYLDVQHDGDHMSDISRIEGFIRHYVAFSGHNFIRILEPLMRQHQVMVNPSRPLIIYESMSFSLETFDFTDAEPTLTRSELAIDGKRGDADLYFDILDQGRIIGHGKKRLILSGLRAFDEDSMRAMTDSYNDSKQQYENNNPR